MQVLKIGPVTKACNGLNSWGYQYVLVDIRALGSILDICHIKHLETRALEGHLTPRWLEGGIDIDLFLRCPTGVVNVKAIWGHMERGRSQLVGRLLVVYSDAPSPEIFQPVPPQWRPLTQACWYWNLAKLSDDYWSMQHAHPEVVFDPAECLQK